MNTFNQNKKEILKNMGNVIKDIRKTEYKKEIANHDHNQVDSKKLDRLFVKLADKIAFDKRVYQVKAIYTK